MTRDKNEHWVIIGGGQAGAQLIDQARQEGHPGRITLVSGETSLPYQRPPLSKQYLAGKYGADWLLYRPAQFYAQHDVDLRLGQRVIAIDRTNQRLEIDGGEQLAYDRLAITTGTRARKVDNLPGAGDDRVCYLRDLKDADFIRKRLPTAKQIVIVGGGFIGLEVAAVLVQQGHDVVVLEAQPELLSRVARPTVAKFFADWHTRHGVRIETSAEITEFCSQPSGLEVVTASGERYSAQLVVVGVGVRPNSELAADAGIDCEDGIAVNEFACTSDANVVAAGDCTMHPNELLGRRIRLETVHNAVEQAKSAAACLAGHPIPYRQIPWVWSDQYNLRYQSVGDTTRGKQEVFRGDVNAGKFAQFYFDEDKFIGMCAVNMPHEFGACRRILNRKIALGVEEATDPAFSLDRLAPMPPRLDFERPWPARAVV